MSGCLRDCRIRSFGVMQISSENVEGVLTSSSAVLAMKLLVHSVECCERFLSESNEEMGLERDGWIRRTEIWGVCRV